MVSWHHQAITPKPTPKREKLCPNQCADTGQERTKLEYTLPPTDPKVTLPHQLKPKLRNLENIPIGEHSPVCLCFGNSRDLSISHPGPAVFS